MGDLNKKILEIITYMLCMFLNDAYITEESGDGIVGKQGAGNG